MGIGCGWSYTGQYLIRGKEKHTIQSSNSHHIRLYMQADKHAGFTIFLENIYVHHHRLYMAELDNQVYTNGFEVSMVIMEYRKS